jgi:tetratricopeptide (TPR) repeat protein
VGAVTFAPAAFAQADTSGSSAKDEASTATSKAAGDTRRDPKGVTGISPTMERIIEGNAAYLAREFARAADTYQQAIEQDPKNPLPHYMLGQAFVVQTKLDDAERAYQAALRFVGKNAPLRAKLLLVMADLRERQNQLDEADAAWKQYATFIAGTARAAGYPATPAARQKTIATRKQMQLNYAQVKDRIAQRERGAATGAK